MDLYSTSGTEQDEEAPSKKATKNIKHKKRKVERKH